MIDYPALTAACRTNNEFNRVHIDLDRLMAPLELAAIAKKAKPNRWPSRSMAWLDDWRERAPEIFERPERFQRRQFERFAFYRDGSPRERKRLLVCFTGMARRMMIWTPSFLQALDARSWDVVIIERLGSYLEQDAGGARDLDAVLARVEKHVPMRRYAGVTMLGTSGGGGAAIIAALRRRPARGVAIAGSATPEQIATTPRQSGLGAWLRPSRLTYACGDAYEPDQLAAEEMRKSWGGEIRVVPGVDQHNILHVLEQRKELRTFLRDIL